MRDENSAFFENLLSDLDDIENGTAAPSVSAQSMDATRQLLESLNEVGVGYGSIIAEQLGAAPSEYFDVDSTKLDSIYGTYIPQPGDPDYAGPPASVQQPVQQQPVQQAYTQQVFQPGKNWELVEESVDGMKSAKKYGVRSIHSKQVILDNIMMKESALALRNLLNEGESLTNPKVLGLISSGIQYTAAMNDIIKAAKQRSAVLRESRYDKAQELDIVIEQKKNIAKELKGRVLDFLRNEGFISK